MYLVNSYANADRGQQQEGEEVYIDVDDEPIITNNHSNNLLCCDKYFTSPINHSQLNYDCSAPIARNTPENNKCKLIDYRGVKVASFTVDHKTLICLPQAFELFLKSLVGGLHTVYTKLKRLDIIPMVCNVEQVRILRGLGAIQPGVNRCKLISPHEFDTLYEDCTSSGSRPGRPPKRIVEAEKRQSESSSSSSSSSSSCSEENGKEYMSFLLNNQFALAYYNMINNYQYKKNDEENNSCKNLIKTFSTTSSTSVMSNYNQEMNSNASSPTSSLSSSSRMSASEVIKAKNPLSIENLIRKDEENHQTNFMISESTSACTNSLALLNQQLVHRVDYLSTNILVLESNLKQTKQSLEKSLMNERNMRIKYEARIRNLVKLRRLLSVKMKRQNLRAFKSKIQKFKK